MKFYKQSKEVRSLRKNYFECEFCHKKAHDIFPKEWIHGKSLVIGLGFYTENRVRNFIEDERKKYLTIWDVTFCSLECLFKWIAKQFNQQISEQNLINPSQGLR